MNTVATSFWLELKRFWNIKSTLINLIVFPAIMASISLMVYGREDPHVFTAYAVLGSVFAGVWIGILRSTAHAIHMEKRGCTADYNVISGSGLLSILVGKMLFSTFIIGLCTILITLTVTHIGETEMAVSNYSGFLFGICLTIAAFFALGLVLSGVSIFVRSPAEYADVLIFSVVVFSAVFYPLEKQPLILNSLSYVLPTTSALKLTRMSILGNSPLCFQWVLGSACTIAFFFLGFLLLKYAEKKAVEKDLWRLG